MLSKNTYKSCRTCLLECVAAAVINVVKLFLTLCLFQGPMCLAHVPGPVCLGRPEKGVPT